MIEVLGDRIGWAHGKDTCSIRRASGARASCISRRRSTLTSPWHFAPVGEGHDDATWAALLALRAAGYDDVISIEHEDPRYDGEEGTERSLEGLRRALAQLGGAT